MRIAFVEAEGFRGIRRPLRIEMPRGFAIITGRNGSGKSTICDAIEYALTGTLSKYAEGKERGESVEDYVWWRGSGSAQQFFVRVGVDTGDGDIREIVRRRGGERPEGDEIAAMLCNTPGMPSDALSELCRTTIVRDETIAALSVDLAETERFAFVRAALGTDAFESVNTRGKAVLSGLRRRVQEAEGEYLRARGDVATFLSQLSSLRATVAGVPPVADAERRLRDMLGIETEDPARLLSAARQHILAVRRRSDELLAIWRETTAAREERAVLDTPETRERREVLTARRDEIRHDRVRIATAVEELRQAVALDQRMASTRLSLAVLHEHAERVGLRDGHCPVCASAVEDIAFRNALAALQRELRADETAAAERERRLGDALQDERRLATEEMDVEAALREMDRLLRGWQTRVDAVLRSSEQAGVALNHTLELTPLEAAMRENGAVLRTIEESVAILESSSAIEGMAELEGRVASAQARSAALEQRLKGVQSAEQEMKNRLAGIRRAIGELVDERLASLEPILTDLYSRLRPHVDWGEISYHLRGDVRRFLSLSVGENVNPRFTFSSGQRRAIGLAFLLAVHLSRPWCRLRTLILDDPIQHIDDYRALHLVEVLAAIRRIDQQVICAVEDRALADLMCRRLRTGEVGEGALIEMEYRAGEGATVARVDRVRTAVRNLVLTA